MTVSSASMAVSIDGLRSLGGGVAYRATCPALSLLREGLAQVWSRWLSAQDRQGFRAHVTIQNKVLPAAASALLKTLEADFVPREGRVVALALWHYRGGPWEAAARFSLLQS
jgi:hypothetical protein